MPDEPIDFCQIAFDFHKHLLTSLLFQFLVQRVFILSLVALPLVVEHKFLKKALLQEAILCILGAPLLEYNR